MYNNNRSDVKHALHEHEAKTHARILTLFIQYTLKPVDHLLYYLPFVASVLIAMADAQENMASITLLIVQLACVVCGK